MKMIGWEVQGWAHWCQCDEHSGQSQQLLLCWYEEATNWLSESRNHFFSFCSIRKPPLLFDEIALSWLGDFRDCKSIFTHGKVTYTFFSLCAPVGYLTGQWPFFSAYCIVFVANSRIYAPVYWLKLTHVLVPHAVERKSDSGDLIMGEGRVKSFNEWGERLGRGDRNK